MTLPAVTWPANHFVSICDVIGDGLDGHEMKRWKRIKKEERSYTSVHFFQKEHEA